LRAIIGQFEGASTGMPPPFRLLHRDDFTKQVSAFAWQRTVLRVDMHHTLFPAHADWRGEESVRAMWTFHTQQRGFDDIAQHVSIAPDGTIWSGRDWNKAPASVGCNMNADAFMFEAIGNFDAGFDRLEGAQLDSVVGVIDIVQRHFRLPVQALLFHRDVPQTDKTCPGTSVEKLDILAAVARRRLHSAHTQP